MPLSTFSQNSIKGRVAETMERSIPITSKKGPFTLAGDLFHLGAGNNKIAPRSTKVALGWILFALK